MIERWVVPEGRGVAMAYRVGRDRRSFVIRHARSLLLVFALGSLVFLGIIDTPEDGKWVALAFEWLGLPVAVAVFAFTHVHRNEPVAGKPGRWRPWLLAILTYPMFLVLSWSYLLGLNAVLPATGSVEYRGRIIEKHESHGRHSSYSIRLIDERTKESVTLAVSACDYPSLAEGQTYVECFETGRLGIPFHWRYGAPVNPCSHSAGVVP